MATQSAVPVVLDTAVRDLVPTAKLLVVGAGGIGCEILKNLALSGFSDIEIIDLDTIDVSNLNRQFLFRKEHVGKSKAMVAKETILGYNPNIQITAYHDSITTSEYGVNFFKRFHVVLNALDNRAARNHVNRMCLAADVPLIESGTSGYSGQVEFIKKGVTQCYECQPKPPQKTFPGCTIRNTPSEPVHCIVWAKHLFNQLFGEEDPDQDVSPDTADPEAAGDAGKTALVEEMDTNAQDGNVQRTSTKQWAVDIDYDPEKLFNKFFGDDIKYLLSMENLWKSRKAPLPLSWSKAQAMIEEPCENASNIHRTDMQVWSLSKCTEIFDQSIASLKKSLQGKSFLVWDKDDKPALDFVTACANIRSYIFSIQQKSRFDVKSIAGNIIPAIATTNAMVAGLVVLMAMRVLANDFDHCQSIYVRQKSSVSNTVLMAERVIEAANPKCYVCAPQPFVNVYVNINSMTLKDFENEVLKKSLNMIAPDALIDGKGIVIISSDEGETDVNNDKKLSELGIFDGSILKVDDFLQDYELTVCVHDYEAKEKDDPPFKISSDVELKTIEEVNDAKNGENNGNANGSGDAKAQQDGDDDDDIAIVESVVEDDPQEGPSKRRKMNPPEDEDDDLVLIEEDDD